MNAVVQQAVAAAVDRRKFLGGSDIAAVLGISPWTTPVQLYHKKTSPPVEDKGNRREKSRGKRWEAVVGEMLVEELEEKGHRVEIVAANKRYVDPSVNYFACEIDFELRLDGEDEITNCELKTVHPFKSKEWGEAGTDNSPVWYTAQAMQGLGITGRRRCLVAALFGADELKTYPIGRDEETILGMRMRGTDFWVNHVLARVPPEPVSLEDLKLLFPTEFAGRQLVADEDTIEIVLRMRALDREIKAREGEWEHLEFKLKRLMGDACELLVRDKSAATWKLRPHQYIDQEALKERFPKVYKEVLIKDQSRVFALKHFAWDRQ